MKSIFLTVALFSMSTGLYAQSLKTSTDSVSYALGFDVGFSLASNGVQVDKQKFLQGLEQALTHQERLINTEESMRLVQQAFAEAAQHKNQALQQQEKRYFDRLKEDQTLTAGPEGMYYEVIQGARGPKPSPQDEVRVHYVGTLPDGTVFDSSVARNAPIVLSLERVVRGWQLGIPMMSVGAKYKFYIPSSIGYGERPSGKIPAYSPLIFEVELLEIMHSDEIQ